MNKIIKSLSLVLAVAAIAGYGTYSYFSDTEASNGNTFTAGSIDLSLGGDFSSLNNVNGTPQITAANPSKPGQALYNFTDLKPGDQGGGSFNLAVTSNEAYVCAKSTITGTPENVRNYPELNAGDLTTGSNEGELQNFLQLATFADYDGDGKYDVNEPVNVNQYGGDGDGFTMAEIAAAGWVPVADPTSPNTWLTIGSLQNAIPKSAGMLYCFGKFTTTGSADTTQVTGCNGADVNGNQNVAQTDGIVGGIEFYAVQTRNNSTFRCSDMNKVGAANYVVPVNPTCNVTVDASIAGPYDTIQKGIDAATAGQTVCVKKGVYSEFIVAKELTVLGLNDPEGANAAIVKPSSASVGDLALVNSSNVTITGLQFDGTGTTFASQAAGIRVSPLLVDLSGVNITYNVVKNIATANGSAAKGIQWFVDKNLGQKLINSNFTNNTIDAINGGTKGGYGIQTVGSMNGVVINNNTISNTTGAWGAGVAVDTKDSALTAMSGNSISLNQIMTNVSGTGRFAVQIENSVAASGFVVNQNNLETLLHGGGNTFIGTEGSLNAKNNWWGTATPVLGTDVFVTGSNIVDFTAPAAAAFTTN